MFQTSSVVRRLMEQSGTISNNLMPTMYYPVLSKLTFKKVSYLWGLLHNVSVKNKDSSGRQSPVIVWTP